VFPFFFILRPCCKHVMSNLLYIEQFDESVPNTPVKKTPPQSHVQRVRPSDALYNAFYAGSGNQRVGHRANVMTNRPLFAKDKLLMQIDMMAGNLRLSRSVN